MQLRGRGVPWSVPLGGLWIAGIGFFVTRFTVTLAAFDGRTQFLAAGIVPLVLGLLLAAFGVALAVGSFDPAFVRTVALWCTGGTLAMAVLVALTLVGTTPDASAGVAVRNDVVLSNFLIGGALLGALTGIYAGENSRNRAELRQQANRLVTINRILRHEVLNAVAVIRGRAETLEDPTPDPTSGGTPRGSVAHIREESDRIVETIEDVKHLSRTARPDASGLSPIDLRAAVDACVEIARERHPHVSFDVEDHSPEPVEVWADGQLSRALYPLVENAAVYGDASAPEVAVALAVGRNGASVRITDTGPGLPPEHRATLERGEIPDYDDPSAGFGNNVARMFVEGYGGEIRTDVTGEGTTVEVALRLASAERPTDPEPRSLGSVSVDRSRLLVATGASIVAGGVMGLVMQLVVGVIPIIGALYGVVDPLVGWITHEFHSVVFGLVFAGAVALLPPEYGDRFAGRTGVALAWGLLLWLVAAGVIMPIWLNLVGIPAALPSLSLPSLVSHLLWGATLAATYHAGTTWRSNL